MTSDYKLMTHCFIPGCTAIAEWNRLQFFKMSFGDLPHWWRSTAWVAKYGTVLPEDALICERHFEERFIDRSRKKPRLLVGTIPTLNLASLEVDNENNLEYFCRLCAKKGFTPMRYRLEYLDGMTEVLQFCLGRYRGQMGLPTGVCDTCINVMKRFSHFVRQCEESQLQILELQAKRRRELMDEEQEVIPAEYTGLEANKENTDTEDQFETKVELPGPSQMDDHGSEATAKKKGKQFTEGKPCPDCGKMFKTQARYYHHVKSHSELMEFGCQICGKNFTRRTGLRRHLEQVHGGKMKFKCVQCGETFTSKNHLRTHHKEVHWEDIKPIEKVEPELIDDKSALTIGPEANIHDQAGTA
nr:zinc finger protein 543-like [Aedes albopictus]